MPTTPEGEFTLAEVEWLADAIFSKYGHDFRHYSSSSFRRRIRHVSVKWGLRTATSFHERLVGDPQFFQAILGDLTVSVTAMFRQPSFFVVLRQVVLPFLATYPQLRIWVAGCATGEEAYSVAIVLREEGLYERSLIYATDLNPTSVERAREGIYSVEQTRRNAENYCDAQGRGSFSSYFTVAHGHAAIDPALKRNMYFAEHNLVSDEVFGEMHVILCRNVLIYFNEKLQRDTLMFLDASLAYGGFLCLGSTEGLRGGLRDDLVEMIPGSRIYRKRIPA